MSALESGGALIRVWLPSSLFRVTPRPCVRPRLPLTVRHWPVRAGLRLQVISAAEAAKGKSKITANTALSTADLLQCFSCRLWQQQNGGKRNGNGGQHPLDRGTMGLEAVVQVTLQG